MLRNKSGKNTEVMKVVRRNQIRLLPAEKGRGTKQNHKAETEIREIKTKVEDSHARESGSFTIMGLRFGIHL